MKKPFCALILALLPIGGGTVLAQSNSKPFVIPELTSWTAGDGVFTPSGRIVLPSKSKDLRAVAEQLSRDYYELFGRQLSVVYGKAKTGDIVLSIQKDTSLGAEGYKLDIKNVLQASSATKQGLYWATRSILQLAEQNDKRIPQGETVDIPQYALRGFMLDVGRKYIPMSYIRNLVKVLSYYKMNTLQLHLNDNGFKQYFGDDWAKTSAAFRLESTTFPGLAPKGASYSKKEFIELQEMADSLGVEIIPEIDVPAHTLAFTHYKPEIASSTYGADHLDIFKPETYAFVDALLKEYLSGKNPVFRGRRVNIGTDEYSNATEELREKFRYFTDRYVRYVESFGKQACLWGSLKHSYGKTPVKLNDALVFAWSHDFDTAEGIKKSGAKIVSIPDGYTYIVPAAGYYYDYLSTKLIYDKWTPAVVDSKTKLSEQDPSIEGGMFAVWNDHYGNGITPKDIHHRIMPALHYMSLKTWTAAKTTVPYQEMEAKRQMLSEAPGVNELARFSGTSREVLALEELKPTTVVSPKHTEVGYDYTVSFAIDPKKEEKGTILLKNDNATVYLSDPFHGLLGFARDGYLNTFNYRLKPGKAVKIDIQGDNMSTDLYVDGRLVQRLGRQVLYAKPVGVEENLRLKAQYESADKYEPIVYNLPQRGKMYYSRTLVFPLRETGDFKSHIASFKVYNYRLYK